MARAAVLLLLTLLSWTCRAQNGVLNATVFPRPGRPVLQAVWQLEPRVLHYRRVPGDSTIAAVFQTTVALSRGADTLARDAWQTRTPPVAAARAAGLTLLDVWTRPVPPGTYRLTVRITEPGFESQSFTLGRDIVVAADSSRIVLSQPQLLDTFYRGGPAGGPFARGTFQAVPLATDYLADDRRVLHAYVEADGIRERAPGFPLVWRLAVWYRDALQPQTVRTDTVRSAADLQRPVLLSLPIGALPSGNYTVRASLEAASGAVLATSERPFQRSNANPDAVAATVADTAAFGAPASPALVLPDLKKTFVAEFKPAQMAALLRMLLPLATPEEGLAIQTLLRNPDPTYVRPFVYQAFAQRRPDSPDAAWRVYADAVRAVNRDYRRGTSTGYETERGRIQLRYGRPDDRITVPAENGTRPYEVWLYNDLKPAGKAAAFLFYQPGGSLDDYYLLHSTATGETRNPQWRRYLYTDPEAGARSRAEQYFPAR